MDKMPNFFIVGAPKAGTTSLYEYLKVHPEIYMSTIKEPEYFSTATLKQDDLLDIIRDKEKYLELFKKVKNQKIIGEASPFYLSDADAPKSIRSLMPNAKILISLRDPVERELSHFLMFQGWRRTKRSFHDQLKIELENHKTSTEYFALKYGLYFDNVKRYVEIFGENQVKIIIFEEFIKKPEDIIQEILKFLNLNTKLLNLDTKIHNPSQMLRGSLSQRINENRSLSRLVKFMVSDSRRLSLKEKFLYKKQIKPKLEQEDRELLKKFYQEDVEKLQKFLGRELPWPNF